MVSKSGNNMLPRSQNMSAKAGFGAHIGGFGPVAQGAVRGILTYKLTHKVPLKSALDRHMSGTDPVHR